MKNVARLVLLFALLEVSGCDRSQPPIAMADSGASSFTLKHNQQLASVLNLAEQEDFIQARRGLIAEAPLQPLVNAAGKTIWNPADYHFIEGQAPATVNPSLWRQAQLNNIRGLFKVSEGIYQLRGFDLANMTLIEGATGWIVVDPLTTIETARQALAFAREHLGDKPLSAIIFTHSHIDHFGGVLGIASAQEVHAGNIEIIAPSGFIEEATSENLIAGPAMTRRAMYMYGQRLPRSANGHVDTGLGKQPVFGSTSILKPTIIIDQPLMPMTVDGVEFIFQDMAGSEAPAELVFYLPGHNAFCGAEVVSRNQHNLYTLRGAKVRDGLHWANHIDEAIKQLGGIDIYFGSHHWPIWGHDRIVSFMQQQRDMYRFIHDQTIRLANLGYTPGEIAEQIKLPASLASHFSNRDYYGTISHNSKAVYQYYFGWYDGNPANLNPLPPEAAATRYVEFMGGPAAVMEKARHSYEQGDYRWVAEVLNHVVFADPDNMVARKLLPQRYQQMAYQAESGPWRDVYLSGAFELLNGGPDSGVNMKDAVEFLREVPVEEFIKVLTVQLKAEKADGEQLMVNIVFTDLEQSFVLDISNSVLHYQQAEPNPAADATLLLSHGLFIDILVGDAGLKEMLTSNQLSVEGSTLKLLKFFSLLGRAQGNFNIVEP